MKSYRRLLENLPDDFIDVISEQYTTGELDKILAGFMCERPVTLRINRLKTSVRQVMDVFRDENIKFDRVMWYEDALVIRNKREKDLEKHAFFQNGSIYLQSLSSMIPPLVLNPNKGWKVLDLTAAPGSKTTQLASLMENQGFILANELNGIRAERLKFNIKRQGAEIAEVRIGDGKKLEDKWNDFFDAVLLDAPCSGTGLFSLNNPKTYGVWSLKTVERLKKEQRKLLETAALALKRGGIIVYSTCSIIKQENEDNILWFTENFKDQFVPEQIDLKLTGLGADVKMINNKDIKNNMMLIFPSEFYEGFFICRLRKRK